MACEISYVSFKWAVLYLLAKTDRLFLLNVKIRPSQPQLDNESCMKGNNTESAQGWSCFDEQKLKSRVQPLIVFALILQKITSQPSPSAYKDVFTAAQTTLFSKDNAQMWLSHYTRLHVQTEGIMAVHTQVGLKMVYCTLSSLEFMAFGAQTLYPGVFWDVVCGVAVNSNPCSTHDTPQTADPTFTIHQRGYRFSRQLLTALQYERGCQHKK